MCISNRFIKRIRMVGVEQLVRPHERDEVLGIAQINDIMRPAGNQ